MLVGFGVLTELVEGNLALEADTCDGIGGQGAGVGGAADELGRGILLRELGKAEAQSGVAVESCFECAVTEGCREKAAQ